MSLEGWVEFWPTKTEGERKWWGWYFAEELLQVKEEQKGGAQCVWGHVSGLVWLECRVLGSCSRRQAKENGCILMTPKIMYAAHIFLSSFRSLPLPAYWTFPPHTQHVQCWTHHIFPHALQFYPLPVHASHWGQEDGFRMQVWQYFVSSEGRSCKY